AILRAAKQCRRATVPHLLSPVPLADALALPLWREAELRWAMVEAQGGGTDYQTAAELGRAAGAAASAALGTRPGSGWADAGIRPLSAAGATTITLGGRVLRAETAALVGLTALQWAYGDLRPG